MGLTIFDLKNQETFCLAMREMLFSDLSLSLSDKHRIRGSERTRNYFTVDSPALIFEDLKVVHFDAAGMLPNAEMQPLMPTPPSYFILKIERDQRGHNDQALAQISHSSTFQNFDNISHGMYFPQLQAFAPAPTFGVSTLSSTSLSACRINAKKEKRQRNRENMRKFQKRGKTSRKKMMRKVASSEMRQLENEFIAKCFTSAVDEESGKK